MTGEAADRLAHSSYPWTASHEPELRDCPHPWDRVDVTREGSVLACCFAQEPLGNLRWHSLDAILRGARRRALQEAVSRNAFHPTCLAAACLYADSAARKPWAAFIAPDRFKVWGWRDRSRAVALSTRPDQVLIEGPARFLPEGSLTAQADLRVWGLPNRPLRLELRDETGSLCTSTDIPVHGTTTPSLAFDVPASPRRRYSIRLIAGGPGIVASFRGLSLAGHPSRRINLAVEEIP